MNAIQNIESGGETAPRSVRAPGIDAAPAPFVGGDPDTRRRIREQSRRLFERFGYAKTTIGEIADACEMSPANLYRHYRNKQAIGQAVVMDYVAESAALVQTALDAPADSVEARLRAALTEEIMCTVKHLREAPRLIELAEMVFASKEGRALIDEQESAHRQMMRDLVALGVASGEFRVADTEAAAAAALMCLRYFYSPFDLSRRGLDQVEENLELAFDLVCAGLRSGAFRAA